MIEFQRIEAPGLAMGGLSAETGSGLVVGLARNREDVEQAQRLRHAVFSTEFAAVFPNSPAGLDQDLFDPWCEHLIVRELNTGRVVGTYRILTPEKAREAGGYYSAGEFAISGLLRRYPDLVEFGRSCTHPDHRNGAAIMLLSVDSMTRRYRRHFGLDSILPAALSRRLDSDLEQFERQPYLAPF
jgi:putative hemolysin